MGCLLLIYYYLFLPLWNSYCFCRGKSIQPCAGVPSLPSLLWKWDISITPVVSSCLEMHEFWTERWGYSLVHILISSLAACHLVSPKCKTYFFVISRLEYRFQKLSALPPRGYLLYIHITPRLEIKTEPGLAQSDRHVRERVWMLV